MKPQAEEGANKQDSGAPIQPILKAAGIPLMVFGFAYYMQDMVSWADEHHLGAGEDEWERMRMARGEMASRLPEQYRVAGAVEGPLGAATCIVICYNTSQDDMDKSKDRELIKLYQNYLDDQREPQWYIRS